jgi:hypothetical protein
MFGVSATTAAALASAGATAYSAYKSGKGPSQQTSTQQQQLDPRLDKMLFGQNGSGGLLDKYQGYLDQPQSAALQGYGKSAGDYLNSYGGSGFGQIQNAASGLMQPKDAKMADLLGYAVGNQVQAPGQNNINLSGSYDSLINGQPGNNPYLTGAIQKGINQSSNAFGNMVTDAKNATQDVLGSIRGNSVLTGQYGGSRQGLAEGKAIDSMNTNLARAASQFGQNNTDAAVAAQAGAYDADRNRQLSATQGLGGQQYATAIQNANTKNAAEFLNVGNLWDASKTNAAMTNQQMQANNQATTAGAGILSGLMGQAYGTAQNADNAGINRASQVNGLLSPYLGANQSQTSTNPVYQNTTGNVLGGAMAGLGLYNQFKGMGGPAGGTSMFAAPSSVDNMAATIGNQQLPISLPGLLG